MYPSLVLGLAIAVGAPGPKEAPKAVPARIEGEWVVESYMLGGKDVGREKGGTFVIADGKIALLKDGRRREEVEYKLDPKADPPRIDLSPPAKEKEGVIPGIYKLDGDTLTLCFPKGQGDRPTKFESPAESKIVLMTLKRAKKE
jgi:uncharacterized protein (TIGR03067 family)